MSAKVRGRRNEPAVESSASVILLVAVSLWALNYTV
jgi:hypothetical protein